MDAYKILGEHGLTHMLKREVYCTPVFRNTKHVRGSLVDIVLNHRSVMVIGDYDVDGLMCSLIMLNGLRQLGVKDLHAYQYAHRMHTLDPMAVQECIQHKYDYCIICDCGSHDLSLLRMLLAYGTKVILLDHHQTLSEYSDFDEMGDLAVINTAMEQEKYCLSAGALCFCVMDDLFKHVGRDAGRFAPYALVSLFSDCMNMGDQLNRAIYSESMKVCKGELPGDIQMFMNEYQTLNNRFITFWMAPRINAMFRAEYLDVLNKLFLSDKENAAGKAKQLEFMNIAYEENRELIHKITDLIEVEDAGGIVIGNLQSVNRYYGVEQNKLWNYTGLVANSLSSFWSKPAFVYCQKGVGYKGSVRDVFGRDYLSVFRQLCDANGHKPAFGCNIAALDFDDFMFRLRRAAKKMAITEAGNKPVVIDYRYNNPDNALIEDVAFINEFAGQEVPVVLLKKQLVGGIKEMKTKYNYKYSWGDYFIQSQFALEFGSMMLLRPTKSYRTKLIVQ